MLPNVVGEVEGWYQYAMRACVCVCAWVIACGRSCTCNVECPQVLIIVIVFLLSS